MSKLHIEVQYLTVGEVNRNDYTPQQEGLLFLLLLVDDLLTKEDQSEMYYAHQRLHECLQPRKGLLLQSMGLRNTHDKTLF